MRSVAWLRERGVSDVISFVLVFGLITSAVGVVYVSGFTGLEDARNAERVENAERAFDVLADNMADIYRRDAPSRKTEVKLADSEMRFAEPSTFSVTIEGVNDLNGNQLVFESNTRPLVFGLSEGSESRIIYENGAILRTERGGAVMLRQPPFLIAEDRTVLNYVVVSRGEGAEVLSGDGTILVRGVRQGRSVLVANETGPVEVTLTINTSDVRAPVWAGYVNDRADWSGANWDGSGDVCTVTDPVAIDGEHTVTCTFAPEEFYLTSTGIRTTITP